MPKNIQARMPVNMSSNALANVFNIELSDFKNKLVTIPIAALLRIIINTFQWNTRLSESQDKASNKPPPPLSLSSGTQKLSSNTLQIIESTYMNAFWSIMSTVFSFSFSRYSLQTPAKHELNTWTSIKTRLMFMQSARSESDESDLLTVLAEQPACFIMQPSVNRSSEIH